MAFLRNTFRKYPLVSNCVIYGTLYVTAEFSQQTVLKKVLREPKTPEPPYDTGVMKRYAIVGTGAMSPALFYWYKWLDGKFPGTATKIVVRKCIMDQFLFTPHLLAIFYISMSLLEGKDDVFAELKKKFVPTFIANSFFWMPIQALNFLYIPARFRVVYIGCCTLVWVNILCWFKRKE
ncbi:unnamed protein product [Orchesella dallaii]|uniref:Mpv17-like protein n=1 Tax=Orchesella dallaii TaxID=48710 RepID=A0ABP1S2G4_9HEXA